MKPIITKDIQSTQWFYPRLQQEHPQFQHFHSDIALHCHVGVGRLLSKVISPTDTIIACYLGNTFILKYFMEPNEQQQTKCILYTF